MMILIESGEKTSILPLPIASKTNGIVGDGSLSNVLVVKLVLIQNQLFFCSLPYLMNRGVVGPGELDDPGPGGAVHLLADGVQLVLVGAGDGRQVGALLSGQLVGARAEAQVGVLVQGRDGLLLART